VVVGGILALTRGRQRQTHVIEVNAAGLHIQSAVMGDTIDRFHPRAEVLYVASTIAGLEVVTTKDDYTCLGFADPKIVQGIACVISRELHLSTVRPPSYTKRRPSTVRREDG
jgi:hypothetical protein